MADSSDEEGFDPDNYKGIYAEGSANDKSGHDPMTGAHFKVTELRRRLRALQPQESIEEYTPYGNQKGSLDSFLQVSQTTKA